MLSFRRLGSWRALRGGIRSGLVVAAAVGPGLSASLGRDHSGAGAPQRGRATGTGSVVWPAAVLQWKGKIPGGFRPSGLLLSEGLFLGECGGRVLGYLGDLELVRRDWHVFAFVLGALVLAFALGDEVMEA